MGFWSLFKRNEELFKFSDEPPSHFLQAALADASRRPLNDFTYRLVIATPDQFFIHDVELYILDSLFNSWEKVGFQRARIEAVKFLKNALGSASVDEDFLAKVALVFFDRDFTVASNKGKTYETAWNTLSLDIENRNGGFLVTRGAHHLELPFGRIDLNTWPA
jgi:hypothetical protein